VPEAALARKTASAAAHSSEEAYGCKNRLLLPS
jgi:hypothetical protein